MKHSIKKKNHALYRQIKEQDNLMRQFATPSPVIANEAQQSNTFYRHFRKQYGMKPNDYRKILSSGEIKKNI